MPANPPLQIAAGMTQAANRIEQAVEILHLEGHVMQARPFGLGKRDTMMVRRATQEVDAVRFVGQFEAEQVAVERPELRIIGCAQDHVGKLLRTLLVVDNVGMCSHVAADRLFDAIRRAERIAVTAPRSSGQDTGHRSHGHAEALGAVVQRIDSRLVRGTKPAAEECCLGSLVQGEHMMFGPCGAQIDRAALAAGLLETPGLLVEIDARSEIANGEIDASHHIHSGIRCHVVLPRPRRDLIGHPA